jgi:hypothetical protein
MDTTKIVLQTLIFPEIIINLNWICNHNMLHKAFIIFIHHKSNLTNYFMNYLFTLEKSQE